MEKIKKEEDSFAQQEYKKNVEKRKGIVEKIKILKKSLKDLGVPTEDYVDEEYIDATDVIEKKEEAKKLYREWREKTVEFLTLKEKMMHEFGYGGGPIERDGSISGVDY